MRNRIRDIIMCVVLLVASAGIYIYISELFFDEVKMLETYAVKNHYGEPEVILLNAKNDDGTGIIAGKCGDGVYALSYKPKWIFLKRNNMSAYIPRPASVLNENEDLTIFIDRHETSGYMVGYSRDENVETVRFHYHEQWPNGNWIDAPIVFEAVANVDKYGFFYSGHQIYQGENSGNAFSGAAPSCIAGYDADGNLIWHKVGGVHDKADHFEQPTT